MPSVLYNGQEYPVEAGETVLDALLRQHVPVPHACKAGACGSCMMRATAGTVPARAQSGLKDSWKAQGYFYPCVCVPESEDLTLTSVGADAQTQAHITGLRSLSEDVIEVRLRCEPPMQYHAGQYITIRREADQLSRSYSIACVSGEEELELHVRRISGGRMSGWLHQDAPVGERLTVVGPSGNCFYVPGREEQPMLLVGTGTGLAPLYGILRDALRNGHRGPIHLFHGALHRGGLYLIDELRRIAATYENVRYVPAVLRGDESDGVAVGAIDTVVLTQLPKLAGWRAFVCGDPALVQALRKKFFVAGAASRDIHADAFLPSAG